MLRTGFLGWEAKKDPGIFMPGKNGLLIPIYKEQKEGRKRAEKGLKQGPITQYRKGA
jgi:hypothetical protein